MCFYSLRQIIHCILTNLSGGISEAIYFRTQDNKVNDVLAGDKKKE